MKLKNLIIASCAALAGFAFLAPSAKATLPYNNGDLILGFRASGGAGATTDYEVNVGNAATFVNAAGTVTPTIGNIKADLDNIYGANWVSRGDIFWSVSGAVTPAIASPVIPNNTMFATREEPAVGTQSTPWARPSSFSAGAVVQRMVGMAGPSFGYAAGTNAVLNQTESINSPVGLIQPTNGQASYASYQPGGGNTTGASAFGYFPSGIEGTFTSGTAGSVLDLYMVTPGSGPSTLVGTFTIDNNGVLTFTKAGGAVTANVHFTAAAYAGSEAIAGQQIGIGITRDGDTTSAATVNFSTTNGTAMAGTDFTGQTNTPVSFATNETTKTVFVDVFHVLGFQGDRTFTVTLSGPGAGTTVTSPSSAAVTIVEADPNAGTIAFSSATYQGPEVDAQSTFSVVPVTFNRTSGTTGAVAATLAVTGGSLASGTDYDALPTTVNFADGATSATVNIQLKAIAPGNLPGTIILGLSNPTNGASLGATSTATVTITPVTANVHFASNVYSGSEVIVGGKISVGITRDGNLAKPFTVNFSTANGTAIAGTDYTAQTNVPISFAANQATQTVMVDVAHILGFQGDRAFGVSLTSPTTGAAVTAPTTATVTILEDEAAPAGVIAFSAAAVQANALNGSNAPNTVTLTLNRTSGATGAVAVDVSVTGGSLVNGANGDYTFTNPTTVNFANNATTATVNLQLKTIVSPLPGTIVLTLSNPTNGATLGAITSTTATIVSPGLIALSAATYKFNPVDAHAAPNNLAITLNRASGVNGAVAVNVSTVGGTLVNGNGADYTFTNPTTVNFADGATSATVHIQLNAIAAAKLPGTIVLGLTSPTGGASLGAQATATVTIAKPDRLPPTVVVSAPLPGAIVTTPFTLSGKALDASGIDRVEVTLNGGAVQLATLGTFANGKVTYSLAGLQPENGKNTLVITAVDASGNRSLPLILAVKYLNNRPEFAGSYNGLLVPAVTPANNLSGLLKLTVTPTGTFTGNVALGGFKMALSGVFGNDGQAHFKPSAVTSLALVGAGHPPVALGSLELSIATDVALGAKITGTLKSDPATTVATLSAPRSFFDAKTPATTVDARYTLANKGHFTLVFPAKPQGALPPTDFPQGDGYASLTLTSAGAVSIVGKLADGTPFAAAAKLAKDYRWPFFAPLPMVKGSLAGLATFDDAPAGSDVSGPDLLWLRAAKPTSKYYPAGWPTGLQLDLLGARFVKTPGASVLPGLPAVDPTNGNASLVFSDGKLTGPLTRNVNIAVNDLVKNAPATDKTFALTVVHGTGSILGTFKHTDNTRPAFSGIVFQKGPLAGAYGFFLSTVPLTPGATGESGGVSLTAK